MTDAQFLAEVRRRAGLPDQAAARRACEAVIRQLVARLSWREQHDLAAALPPKLRAVARTAPNTGLRYAPPEALLRELGDELLVSGAEAGDIARAVASVIREVLPPEELRDLRAELLRTFDSVFA